MLKHAKDHLDREGDTDRRIALIGFDQTIEVCIDVFLKLHPKLRAGVQIEGDEKHRALRSFYSKIEFLEGHLETKDFDLGIPVEELVWFHTLRNEIYHSGNGMVPERKVVEDAYLAATKVYEAIFGIAPDVDGLDEAVSGELPPLRERPRGNSAEMDILNGYRLLEEALRRVEPDAADAYGASVAGLWRVYRHRFEDADDAVDWPDDVLIAEVTAIRNAVVHGRPTGMSEANMVDLANAIIALAGDIEEQS